MSHIRGHICPIIKITYTFKVYILYIITYYIHTHSFALHEVHIICKTYKSIKIIYMHKGKIIHDSAILICVIVCFLEWKRIVTALVRSIVHVNIILYVEIQLTVNDADHICKFVVSIASQTYT